VLARIHSFVLVGIDAIAFEVDADVSQEKRQESRAEVSAHGNPLLCSIEGSLEFK
jgi:hypothetical protein